MTIKRGGAPGLPARGALPIAHLDSTPARSFPHRLASERPGEAALSYLERGWVPVQVAPRSKRPTRNEWQRHRPTVEEVRRWSDGSNVGVLLGEASRLVDVDLDCPEAVRLAPRLLPPTPARFGRASSPASHYLYRVEAPGKTVRRQVAGETLVEYRAEGGQTVMPPSTHPSGELVRWEPGAGAPATSARDELLLATGRLGAAVLLVRAGVDDEHAAALVLRAGPEDEAQSLPADVQRWCGWTVPATAPRRQAPRQTSRTPDEDLGPAVARWNAAHPLEWPRGNGVCPACGGKAWKRQGSTDRWVCYHASHEAPGVRGEGCYHGDALDLEAHRARLTVAQVLQRDGYLQPRSAGPRRELAEEEPPPWEPPHDEDTPRGAHPPGRPRIVVEGGANPVNVRDAITALVDADRVFVGPAGLVKLTSGNTGPRTMRPLDQHSLRTELGQLAVWVVKRKGEGGKPVDVPADPPKDRVQAVLSDGEWSGVRRLAGITTCPVLRADGTVLQVPGYDASTRLFYEPSCDYPQVPERPTLAQAQLAADRVLDLVRDFPFASEADRSSSLASILTLVGRRAIAGACPALLVSAPVKGSGKSRLAELAILVGTGLRARGMPASDDAEMRKTLLAMVTEGKPVLFLDNVTGEIGWPSLDQYLTSGGVEGRILGVTRSVGGDSNMVVFITSNNGVLVGDIERRLLSCRLEPKEERPEERCGFTHPDIMGHAWTHRASLTVDALTVLRAFHVAGRPDQGLSPWGSYEAWSALIRGAIVWLGLADPMEARARLRAADVGTSALVRVLFGIERTLPGRRWSVTELLTAAEGDEDLAEALEEFVRPRPATSRESVARKLAEHLDRWVRDRRLRRIDDPKRGHRYWLEARTPPELGGSRGVLLENPPREQRARNVDNRPSVGG